MTEPRPPGDPDCDLEARLGRFRARVAREGRTASLTLLDKAIAREKARKARERRVPPGSA